MDERRRGVSTATGNLVLATGILAPATILFTVVFGAAISPTYDWPSDPFSVLGAAGQSTAGWFSVGLLVGGLLALPFATRLWNARSRSVGALYALVGVSFVGAGLFPFDSVWHEVFGTGILFGIWLLLWAAAVTDWWADSPREGTLSFLLGTAALVVWLPYDFDVEWAQLGYGFAELVAFLAFAAWSVRATTRLRPATNDSTTAELTTTREGSK